MFFHILKSKIHMARVTETKKEYEEEYEGSITIDKDLAQKADLVAHEKVLVADMENGNRFSTYVIYGGAGEICVNGAAANLVEKGDRLIIMAFAMTKDKEYTPTILKLDAKNRVKKK